MIDELADIREAGIDLVILFGVSLALRSFLGFLHRHDLAGEQIDVCRSPARGGQAAEHPSEIALDTRAVQEVLTLGLGGGWQDPGGDDRGRDQPDQKAARQTLTRRHEVSPVARTSSGLPLLHPDSCVNATRGLKTD